MVTRLVVPEAELTLRRDEEGWCQVDLLIRGRVMRLGADQHQVVVARLASALKEELRGDVVGTINGMNVIWVLSLSEAHASIFAAHADGGRVLFFQDASGSLLGILSLTPADRMRWLAQLLPETNMRSESDGD